MTHEFVELSVFSANKGSKLHKKHSYKDQGLKINQSDIEKQQVNIRFLKGKQSFQNER
jgi:hypothetical protein